MTLVQNFHKYIQGVEFVQSVAQGDRFEHIISEKDKSGLMTLVVGMDSISHRIDLPSKKVLIHLLKNQRRADSVIWEKRDESTYRLHIFELKRTVTEAKWQLIKDQFQGAFFVSLCIAKILGLEVDTHVGLYTVYYEDQLDAVDNFTDNALSDVEPDLPAKTKKAILEWTNDLCPFDFTGYLGQIKFLHKKIHLPNIKDGIPVGTRYITG
ncbi:MAG TPA: hypothetical protein DEB39_03370 [Planctomycetaceae bacterium]|nr:hypothetical protein [Planctomycetaceae bacterium]